MKFKSLHKNAKLLDDLIDTYIKTKKTSFAPIGELEKFALRVFPDTVRVDFGLHKLVFHLRHKSHELALKVGKTEAIEHDHRAYRQMPKSLRQVYFARVFWHTKYCLLQEYGVEANVSTQELSQLRAIAYKYGLLDITCENIRRVNGNLKIIDASIGPSGLFRLWKIADFVKLRLPQHVRRAIRKSRLLATVKRK